METKELSQDLKSVKITLDDIFFFSPYYFMSRSNKVKRRFRNQRSYLRTLKDHKIIKTI